MTHTPVVMPPAHLNSNNTAPPTSSPSSFDSVHNNAIDSYAPHSQPDCQDQAPSHTVPSSKYHSSLSVGEWANENSKEKLPFLPMDQDWKDVHRNIKQMDQLYDATFYSWLKSEDNVLVTGMYLHRIANEYSMDRIINAVKWLVADWRWESTSLLVRHITAGWSGEQGDMRRAELLRHLTQTWATQYTATLITTILATPPYTSAPEHQRERFLRCFTNDWDFSKLSEFFMYLSSQANIDYRVKCVMLQQAARRERESLCAKLNRRPRRHHHHHENALTTCDTSTTANETTSYTPIISMDHQSSTHSLHRHHSLESERYAHRRIPSNDMKRQRYSCYEEDESSDEGEESAENGNLTSTNALRLDLSSTPSVGSGTPSSAAAGTSIWTRRPSNDSTTTDDDIDSLKKLSALALHSLQPLIPDNCHLK